MSEKPTRNYFKLTNINPSSLKVFDKHNNAVLTDNPLLNPFPYALHEQTADAVRQMINAVETDEEVERILAESAALWFNAIRPHGEEI